MECFKYKTQMTNALENEKISLQDYYNMLVVYGTKDMELILLFKGLGFKLGIDFVTARKELL